MGLVSCYYNNCTHTSATNLLFRLPINDELRLQSWIKNSGNPSLQGLTQHQLKRCYICQDHFNAAEIIKLKYSITPRLIATAVPQVYLPGQPRIIQHDSADVSVSSRTDPCLPNGLMVKRVKGDRKYGDRPKSTPKRSVCHNAATIKDDPVSLSNDHESEQAHLDVKHEPTDVNHQTTVMENNRADVIIKRDHADVDHQTTVTENNRADVIITREPADVEHQTAVTENNRADVIKKIKPADVEHKTTVTENNRADVNIKKEPADEEREVTITGEDSSDDVEDVRSSDAATVKQELEIGRTVLQPPDIHYNLRRRKPKLADSAEMPRHQRSHSSAGKRPNSRSGRFSKQTTEKKQAVAETYHGSGHCSEHNEDNTSGGSRNRNLHKKQYERSYSCKIRGQSFIQKSPRDLMTHAGEHLYRCEVCSIRFDRRCDLRSHLEIHCDYRPFSCDVCRKSYRRKYALSTHLKTHTGERPYSCEVCGKCFVHNCLLLKHMNVHADKPSHTCDVCSQSFAHNYVLMQHLKIHTDERPHSCEVCNRSFGHKFHLNKHLKVHTALVDADKVLRGGLFTSMGRII